MSVDPASIDDLGTILGVWAHPDDESYLMAGTALRAMARGSRVACVTATAGLHLPDGGLSSKGGSATTLDSLPTVCPLGGDPRAHGTTPAGGVGSGVFEPCQ